MKRILIGLGNPFRGDDGAGLEVASRVRSVETHVCLLGSYELMDLWEGADEVIVVDAMVSSAPPGTVRLFDPHREALPSRTFSSTHAIGVAETIEMAKLLGRLPQRMAVYGIEAADVTAGTYLSPVVEEAVARVTAEIDDA
ncbi:MAG: hydrogenase maturation protease [Acidimicrobiia bacterium]|nr:hydrogenase maturation protease [Acidimicrobiia bacterium]